MALFVMPGFIRGTGLHGREYVHKTRMIAPFGDNCFDSAFFSEVLAADEYNLQALLLSQAFGVYSNLFSKRFRPGGIVEDPYAVGLQETGHSCSIADAGNSAGDYHPIKAGQGSSYFRSMTVSEKLHKLFPRCGFELIFAYASSRVNEKPCLVPACPG